MRASRQPLKHSPCVSDSRLQLLYCAAAATDGRLSHVMLARETRSQTAWTGRLRSLA